MGHSVFDGNHMNANTEGKNPFSGTFFTQKESS